MKKYLQLHCLLFAFTPFANAQDSKLLLDKPGTLKIVDWGVYTHYNCGFTKTETSANYQKLSGIVETARKNNTVLTELKGFDCRPTFFAINCDTKSGYGIPSNIHFEFHSWSLYKNGKEVRWDIEPPHWDITVNVIRPFGNSRGYGTSRPPADECKPGFNYEKWQKAAEKLSDVFHTPGAKQTLVPGIDVYADENIILYNPARPAYWLPVTVKEMYTTLFEYWKNDPNDAAEKLSMQMLEAEYASFSEEEKNSPAYFGGVAHLSQVSAMKTDQQVVRANPAYWNKQLPKQAIQLMALILPLDKKIIAYEKNEALKYQGGSYHQYRFMEMLDAGSLLPLIEK